MLSGVSVDAEGAQLASDHHPSYDMEYMVTSVNVSKVRGADN